VHANDVIGNGLVGGCINSVKHDKQKIETGEQRILQSNVLHGCFELVVLRGKIAVIEVAENSIRFNLPFHRQGWQRP
jgi:hypothetical protein